MPYDDKIKDELLSETDGYHAYAQIRSLFGYWRPLYNGADESDISAYCETCDKIWDTLTFSSGSKIRWNPVNPKDDPDKNRALRRITKEHCDEPVPVPQANEVFGVLKIWQEVLAGNYLRFLSDCDCPGAAPNDEELERLKAVGVLFGIDRCIGEYYKNGES